MIIPLELGAIPYAALAETWRVKLPAELRESTPRRLVTRADEVRDGDLFCALKGKRDGHAYIGEAASRGAAAVLAEQQSEADVPQILLPSVREALALWAIAASGGDKPLRIGITGSVGKTTVKDAIAAMLSVRYAVHATYENRNNDLGVPFTVLSAPRGTEILVCEAGVNHPGEMALLSRILRPHVSVITCIGHAHIGAFGTRERIACEKRALLTHAVQEGRVFVPVGEPLLSFLPPHGILRTAVTPFTEEDTRRFDLPALGEDVPRRFAMAYAASVAEALGMTEEECKEGLRRVAALETRRKESRCGNLLLIDDGYNASPESMLSALAYLSAKRGGRRVAVLGDMLELGERSASYHRAVGRYAATHADLLCFFGAYAKEYAKGAAAAGAVELGQADEKRAHYVCLTGDRTQTVRALAALLQGDETVLFKASRAHEIEKTVALLKKEML